MKYLIAILLLTTQLVFAQNSESERLGGIGIRYTRNAEGMIVIKHVEERSPAAQAGIQTNDIIISIDGSNLKGMDPVNIKNVLRGKVGSTAEIKLENSQTKNEYSVSVVRKIVHFGANDASKDSAKTNTQAEIKNVEKSEVAPKVVAPKISPKSTEKSSSSSPSGPSVLVASPAPANTSAEKTSASAISDSKYFIQTGAFFTKEIANDQVAAFNQKGYTSFIDPTKINGSNIYRVRIGPLATQQIAEVLSKKLASQGITNSIIEPSQKTPKN